jgi:acetyl-CoA carboxylase biotin carboxylase subunit
VTAAMRKIGYHNAGTVEFLYEDGKFYFIEMNTRLQVEHPITEMVTGLDLVREQIRVSAGLELGFSQKDVEFQGCAMECRINAENPRTFAPSPGTIVGYHAPGGRRVRVDSAMYAGSRIPPHYDSLISKLIVQGTTRNECIMRMRRALHEYVIDGIQTTIPLHQAVLEQAAVIDGTYDIRWLETFVAKWAAENP